MSSAPVNSKEGKVLHPDLLNDNLKQTQYAVRGELFLKAEELRQAGKEIIFTNGGYCSLAQRLFLGGHALTPPVSFSWQSTPTWSTADHIHTPGEDCGQRSQRGQSQLLTCLAWSLYGQLPALITSGYDKPVRLPGYNQCIPKRLRD